MSMYHLIVFLPLLACVVAGLGGRWIGDRGAQIVSVGLMVIAALLSIPIFWLVVLSPEAGPVTVPVMTWIQSGGLEANWQLRFDPLSAVMVFVVNVVSSLIHIYSVGYMAKDPSKPRFFAYLSLFTFSMLMLVTADNFAQLFLGW